MDAISRVFDTISGRGGRPLLLLTFGMNYGISGASPAPFRTINFIVHLVNSFLVFLIVFELGHLIQIDATRRGWLALLAAAAFIAHPLLVESVTYVSARSSSLCATFYFIGLFATARAGRTSTHRRWALVSLAVACTYIGWLVKQEAITMPAAGIVLVWLVWPRNIGAKPRWIATVIFALAMAAILVTNRQQIEEVSVASQVNEPLVNAGFESTLPMVPYALTSIKEYGAYYLWRLFVPVHLSVDPESSIINSPVSVPFLFSILLLSLMTLAMLWLRKNRPLCAVGIALILFSPLSAYCLFPLPDVVAEHRAYISVLGSTIIITDILAASSRARMFSLVVLLAYGSLTVMRNTVWADEVLLWEDARAKAPNKFRPHLNLGALYQVRGQHDEAKKEYDFVLSRSPDHPVALANMAAVYLAENDLARVEQLLAPAIERQAGFAGIYLNLGVVRLRQERYEEAKEFLLRAAALNPAQLMVHHNLGDILFNQRRPADAIKAYLTELEVNPDSTITHLHLAMAYEVAGLGDKSISQYREVAVRDPNNAEAKSALQRLMRK